MKSLARVSRGRRSTELIQPLSSPADRERICSASDAHRDKGAEGAEGTESGVRAKVSKQITRAHRWFKDQCIEMVGDVREHTVVFKMT